MLVPFGHLQGWGVGARPPKYVPALAVTCRQSAAGRTASGHVCYPRFVTENDLLDEWKTRADRYLDEKQRDADTKLQNHRQVRLYLLILSIFHSMYSQIN